MDGIVSQNDPFSQWLHDAPEPEAVLSRVLALVARQIKTMSEHRLRLEDHAARMRIVLAADFYYDFFEQVNTNCVPQAAVEVVEMHRRFAKAVVATAVGGAPEETEAVSALADACYVARGRICEECGLPMCLHADNASGGPGDLLALSDVH